MQVEDDVPPRYPVRHEEFLSVSATTLQHLEKEELECRICLNVLDTVRVTECLHRFCKDCIERHLRQLERQQHLCPLCNKEISTARSLRADTRMDVLIDLLFPQRERHVEDPAGPQTRVGMSRGAVEPMRCGSLARLFRCSTSPSVSLCLSLSRPHMGAVSLSSLSVCLCFQQLTIPTPTLNAHINTVSLPPPAAPQTETRSARRRTSTTRQCPTCVASSRLTLPRGSTLTHRWQQQQQHRPPRPPPRRGRGGDGRR